MRISSSIKFKSNSEPKHLRKKTLQRLNSKLTTRMCICVPLYLCSWFLLGIIGSYWVKFLCLCWFLDDWYIRKINKTKKTQKTIKGRKTKQVIKHGINNEKFQKSLFPQCLWQLLKPSSLWSMGIKEAICLIHCEFEAFIIDIFLCLNCCYSGVFLALKTAEEQYLEKNSYACFLFFSGYFISPSNSELHTSKL